MLRDFQTGDPAVETEADQQGDRLAGIGRYGCDIGSAQHVAKQALTRIDAGRQRLAFKLTDPVGIGKIRQRQVGYGRSLAGLAGYQRQEHQQRQQRPGDDPAESRLLVNGQGITHPEKSVAAGVGAQ